MAARTLCKSQNASSTLRIAVDVVPGLKIISAPEETIGNLRAVSTPPIVSSVSAGITATCRLLPGFVRSAPEFVPDDPLVAFHKC